jgi:hypothetical protein
MTFVTSARLKKPETNARFKGAVVKPWYLAAGSLKANVAGVRREGIYRMFLLCRSILNGVGSLDFKSSAMTAEINAIRSQSIMVWTSPCSKMAL